MPAMLAAYRIGLHRENQVLMHAGILPPYTARIGVATGKRPHSVHLPHHPRPLARMTQFDQAARPSLAPTLFLQTPAAQMMRAGDHARPDRFGDPHLIDEIANLGRDLEQAV